MLCAVILKSPLFLIKNKTLMSDRSEFIKLISNSVEGESIIKKNRIRIKYRFFIRVKNIIILFLLNIKNKR